LTALLLAGLAVYTYAPAQTATLQGTFTYVPEKSDNVDQAIEVAVSKLNFFVRSIARKRLREMNEPYQRIAIELTPTQVSITGDHSAPIRTAPDGNAGRMERCGRGGVAGEYEVGGKCAETGVFGNEWTAHQCL